MIFAHLLYFFFNFGTDHFFCWWGGEGEGDIFFQQRRTRFFFRQSESVNFLEPLKSIYNCF